MNITSDLYAIKPTGCLYIVYYAFCQSRTGGLVIWRSGSTVVLYRGMGYKLDCVQSYARQTQDKTKEFESSGVQVNNFARSIGTSCSAEPSTAKSYSNNLSVKELKDLSELNLLLDGLGPRFKDWSGHEPMPVDADLLPDVVPGYRPHLGFYFMG